MPIHDWTRVEAAIFHDFHHAWIEEIKRALNGGLLPKNYYALAEQIAGSMGPDVLTLHHPSNGAGDALTPSGGIALAEKKPKVRFHARNEPEQYAAKAKAVVVRHASKHQVVAMVEIMSPGNKSSQHHLQAFVRKAEEAITSGIHLLIVDLFPPTPRDPEGIHPLIWNGREDEFVFDPAKPLTCAAYVGGVCPQAFIEPAAIGDALPEMPLFLTPEVYVPVPLEGTYTTAWGAVPEFWRGMLKS